MTKTNAIMDLVSGYQSYSSAEEIGVSAVTDAPATTAYCAAATVTWLTGLAVSKTVDNGC